MSVASSSSKININGSSSSGHHSSPLLSPASVHRVQVRGASSSPRNGHVNHQQQRSSFLPPRPPQYYSLHHPHHEPSFSSSFSSSAEDDDSAIDHDRDLNHDPHDHAEIKLRTFPPLFILPGRTASILIALIAIALALCCTVFRGQLEDMNLTTLDLLRYASIPLISVAFTYVHIWLALLMTFYPIKFFGICQIPGTNVGVPGWQGIVPFKAEEMARTACKLMTERLINVQEIFSRLNPTEVAAQMGPVLHSTLEDIIQTVAHTYVPNLWSFMPESVRSEVIRQAHEDAPPAIEGLMRELQANITQVFDIETMAVEALVRDKSLLNSIFLTCGYNELCFIRNAGAWMGFGFGLIQMAIWIVWSNKWLLPGFGLVVGLLTNYLALKVIFAPVEPIYLCGRRSCCFSSRKRGATPCCVLHGLFLRRQAEVSRVYAAVITKRVLNARNILQALICGPATEKLFTLVYTHLSQTCDSFLGTSSPFLHLIVGTETIVQVKDDLCQRLLDKLPMLLQSLEEYTDHTLDLETTMREKLTQLPSLDFERLLHPVFEADEWKLIVMGGVLGVIIGFSQVYMLIG